MTSKSPSADANGTMSNNVPRDAMHGVRSQVSSLDQDVARLTAVLSGASLTTSSDAELEELNESSLAALLKQIEGADGVLSGVEDKLEGILGNLDALLAALEKKGVEVEGDDADDTEANEEGKKAEDKENEDQKKDQDTTRGD